MSPRFSASKLVRLLMPPIIFKVARYLGRAEWEYVADQWPKNDQRSFGWDDSSVVKNMRDNWGAYKQALESTARLVFWPWFTAAPDISAHNSLMTWGYV